MSPAARRAICTSRSRRSSDRQAAVREGNGSSDEIPVARQLGRLAAAKASSARTEPRRRRTVGSHGSCPCLAVTVSTTSRDSHVGSRELLRSLRAVLTRPCPAARIRVRVRVRSTTPCARQRPHVRSASASVRLLLSRVGHCTAMFAAARTACDGSASLKSEGVVAAQDYGSRLDVEELNCIVSPCWSTARWSSASAITWLAVPRRRLL